MVDNKSQGALEVAVGPVARRSFDATFNRVASGKSRAPGCDPIPGGISRASHRVDEEIADPARHVDKTRVIEL